MLADCRGEALATLGRQALAQRQRMFAHALAGARPTASDGPPWRGREAPGSWDKGAKLIFDMVWLAVKRRHHLA